MKTLQLLLLTTFIAFFGNTQDLLTIQGNGELIADFNSTYEKPNVKGLFLDKHLTLVSVIEGTEVVKCQVRIGGMVNLIGIWELNDLNDVLVKVYEVQIEKGITDVLLVSFADNKAIQMNLFQLFRTEKCRRTCADNHRRERRKSHLRQGNRKSSIRDCGRSLYGITVTSSISSNSLNSSMTWSFLNLLNPV
jgi:hypothetical protein